MIFCIGEKSTPKLAVVKCRNSEKFLGTVSFCAELIFPVLAFWGFFLNLHGFLFFAQGSLIDISDLRSRTPHCRSIPL